MNALHSLHSLHSRASRLYRPSRDHLPSGFSAEGTVRGTLVRLKDDYKKDKTRKISSTMHTRNHLDKRNMSHSDTNITPNKPSHNFGPGRLLVDGLRPRLAGEYKVRRPKAEAS